MSRQIWVIFRREIKNKFGVGFVIATILIPAFMAAIIGIQTILSKAGSGASANITFVLENNAELERLLRQDLVPSGKFQVAYEQVPRASFGAYLERHRQELVRDSSRSIVLVPDSAITDKVIRLYSANPGNNDVRTRVSAAVNKALNLDFFTRNNIQNVDIKFIQTDVTISGSKVSTKGTEAESWGGLIVAFALGLLLMLGITFNAMPVMNAVVTDKTNRVYELLLTSVKPRELMWGKILGVAAISTAQMLIWVVSFAVLVFVLNDVMHVSQSVRMDLSPLLIGYYLLNYVIGLSIFLALYGGLSAMHENPNNAAGALFPVYLLILLPFYTIFSVLANPANAAATVLSIAPFTSLYVMPARMALIDVPIWQIALSLALNILVLRMVIGISGKVYRLSILLTGAQPTLKQLLDTAEKA
jgi:ABC-2 type transport system permease protein